MPEDPGRLLDAVPAPVPKGSRPPGPEDITTPLLNYGNPGKNAETTKGTSAGGAGQGDKGQNTSGENKTTGGRSRSAQGRLDRMRSELSEQGKGIESPNDVSPVKQTGDLEVKQAENQVSGENENSERAKADTTIAQPAAEQGKLSDYRKIAKARRRKNK